MGKKSQTTSKVYGNTTTSNPYATASTNNSGTTSAFKEGTALDTIYNYVNNNIGSLLDEYMNPNINSATNQAKLNAYTSALNTEAAKSLENNIINPLSNRNMIRSSQATDLYKNLSESTTDSLSSYVNELIAESQENTAAMMNNLLSAYMQGYNVISDMQNQSLQTSAGNATTTTTAGSSLGGNISSGASSANSILDVITKAIQLFAKK